MRVGTRPLRRQPDLLEQLGDPRVDPLLGQLRLVYADRLGDLRAHAQHRVERVQGALEDDRGAGPAHRAQVAPPHRLDVVAQHPHLAADLGVLRLQAEHGADQRRLAAPGLAGDTHHLAGVDLEVDAADRGQGPSEVR